MNSNLNFKHASFGLHKSLNEYASKLNARKSYPIYSRIFRQSLNNRSSLATQIAQLIQKPANAEFTEAVKIKYCLNLFLSNKLFAQNKLLRTKSLEYMFAYDFANKLEAEEFIKTFNKAIKKIPRPRWYSLIQRRAYKRFLKECLLNIEDLKNEQGILDNRAEVKADSNAPRKTLATMRNNYTELSQYPPDVDNEMNTPRQETNSKPTPPSP